MAPKGQRIQLYVDSAALVLIDQAAESEGRNRSEFMVAASLERAKRGPDLSLVDQLRAAMASELTVRLSLSSVMEGTMVHEGAVVSVGHDYCRLDLGRGVPYVVVHLAHLVGLVVLSKK